MYLVISTVQLLWPSTHAHAHTHTRTHTSTHTHTHSSTSPPLIINLSSPRRRPALVGEKGTELAERVVEGSKVASIFLLSSDQSRSVHRAKPGVVSRNFLSGFWAQSLKDVGSV